MRPNLLPALLAVSMLSACAAPGVEFIPSRKSAVELRAIQARAVPADADTTVRGVVATLHDLGYRITRVEPEARTISATRHATLRLAVVVQPRGETESLVRANASLIDPLREAQVDSPEFYQRNFFEPLGAMMARAPMPLAADEGVPDAPRPVAEVNTVRAREAAARASGNPPTPTPGRPAP